MVEGQKLAGRKRIQKGKGGLSDKELCAAAKGKPGAKEAKIIRPGEVETAVWVRLKCQYGCDCYGQCLVCPPYTPTPEVMR